MATAKLESMIDQLFTAPAKAVILAEREYRKIWVDWLSDLKKLLPTGANADPEGFIGNQMNLAPVMQLNAKIDIGLTMRMASVKEIEAGGSIGVAVGPISASGNFGFMSRSSQESVMQVHAQYTMSNGETSLLEYLTSSNLKLSTAADVDKAITFLNKA